MKFKELEERFLIMEDETFRKNIAIQDMGSNLLNIEGRVLELEHKIPNINETFAAAYLDYMEEKLR